MQLRSRHAGSTPWRGTPPKAAPGGEAVDRAGLGRATPGRRADVGIGRGEPKASHRFFGQLDWMLQRLSSAHVRITLVRVVLPEAAGPAPGSASGAAPGAADVLADALDDSYGLAGALADGSVLAAFFGPRQPGVGGDSQQAQAILRRLRQVLQDAGIGREASGTSVFLIHRWTDEIGDVSTLMLDSMSGGRAAVALFEPLSI